jgi:hypothetical protein
MIQRPKARSCCLILAAMTLAEAAHAGIWETDPVVGIAGDFSTNPGLLYVEHSSETHEDLLLDVPTTYHANDLTLTVLPSFRVSNSAGYSSLASDYEHLTAAGELDSERGSVTLTGQVDRDSSLYHDYELNGSAGVRRDTTLADLAWLRSLTERLSFNVDINSSRVIYGRSNGVATLTDYHYTSAAPALSWKTNERTSFTLSETTGLYASSDGATKSSNSNLELGFIRQLTELWSLTAKAGYSRESNKISGERFVGCKFIIGPYCFDPIYAYETVKSTDKGSVFTANITRQGERLALTGSASRSIVPTGFAFLATQTYYQLSIDYPWTERWKIDGYARRLSSKEPQAFGPEVEQSYWALGLSAAWQMTEKWTLTLSTNWISAKYTPPDASAGATEVDLQLSRHFDPIQWH